MKKKKARKKRQGLGQYRIPTAKGTTWFKDKSKYDRKRKHKNRENADESIR
jgi:hypothetical protein